MMKGMKVAYLSTLKKNTLRKIKYAFDHVNDKMMTHEIPIDEIWYTNYLNGNKSVNKN